MTEQLKPIPEHKEHQPGRVFTLIIPTRNEADNVDSLFSRLVPNLRKYPSEVIFVDDSDDNTESKIKGRTWPFPVRVIHREGEDRKGGLSTAVIEGIKRSTGQYIGVMDADLQHPPETLPQLLDTAISKDDDIVIASRFISGGSMDGLANPARRIMSTGTILVTHVLFPELKKVTDPMSGFFVFNRRLLEGTVAELNPQGFKILLELLVRTQWVNLDEVPLQFERRANGKSKLDTKEALSIYSHIFKLFMDQTRTRNRR